MSASVFKRLSAEFVGTAFLLAIVVGSGVMGDALSSDDGVALLGNTLATGAGLVVLILIFGGVSGAHFNPIVTLSFCLQRQISSPLALGYLAVQLIGAVAGVWMAHALFDLSIVQESVKARDGFGQVFSEGVATFALVLTIIAVVRQRPEAVPYAVGLVITAGYWYTSSTSFANPAVTIARSLTDTFAGIQPSSVIPFIGAQIVGAVMATGFGVWLISDDGREGLGARPEGASENLSIDIAA